MSNTVKVTNDPTEDHEVLECPSCRGEYVHIDEVHVGGRPTEDGPFHNVTVDAAGQVHQSPRGMAVPQWAMRRHYISLVGWCEGCNTQFAYSFVQHKGQTFLQSLKADWALNS